MLQPGYSAVPLVGYPSEIVNQLNQQFQSDLSFTRQVEFIGPIAGAAQPAELPFTSPAANFAETPEAYFVVVELPGIELKDVSLQIQGEQLVLTAFRKPIWSQGAHTYGYLATEGRFGSLRRAFVLPAGCNRSAIHAQFGHGLLTICLPKAMPQPGALQNQAISEVSINAAL